MLENPNDTLIEHPKVILDRIVESYGSEIAFEFSVYEYRPRSVVDERDVFTISAKKISDKSIIEMISFLPKGRELALNSRVYFSEKVFKHIPMIDFSTVAAAQLAKVSLLLPATIFDSMMWFDSGRSFHGYGQRLISAGDWTELMGRLLLVNLPGHPPIIDPRWIGHRLIAGYSALRWSRNTLQYLQQPRLTKKVFSPHS